MRYEFTKIMRSTQLIAIVHLVPSTRGQVIQKQAQSRPTVFEDKVNRLRPILF
jgi:hypothetical protein